MSFSLCCVCRYGAVRVCCVIFLLLCVQVWGSQSLLCHFPSAVCTGVGQSEFAVLFSLCCVCRCGAVGICCVIFLLLCVQVWGSWSLLCIIAICRVIFLLHCVQVWGSPSLLCYFPSAVCTGVGQSEFAVLFSFCCVYRCGAVRVCCVRHGGHLLSPHPPSGRRRAPRYGWQGTPFVHRGKHNPWNAECSAIHSTVSVHPPEVN